MEEKHQSRLSERLSKVTDVWAQLVLELREENVQIFVNRHRKRHSECVIRDAAVTFKQEQQCKL